MNRLPYNVYIYIPIIPTHIIMLGLLYFVYFDIFLLTHT